MEINSTDIDKNLEQEIYGEEKIILQGIIDCYFEENGEIILVDYKTDSVKNGEVKLINREIQVSARLLCKGT